MLMTNDQLTTMSASAESWLRGKIDDAQVTKTIEAIHSVGDLGDLSVKSVQNQTITGITGTVICVIFYWRITLDTPDGHHYSGNAGGIGSVGGGGIQGGALVGVPDMNTLYSRAVSFQFNSAAAALNVNFFDGSSNLIGTFVGGGLGLCMGTGGGSGSWSPNHAAMLAAQ